MGAIVVELENVKEQKISYYAVVIYIVVINYFQKAI
jgi:hypothetical protein